MTDHYYFTSESNWQRALYVIRDDEHVDYDQAFDIKSFFTK